MSSQQYTLCVYRSWAFAHTILSCRENIAFDLMDASVLYSWDEPLPVASKPKYFPEEPYCCRIISFSITRYIWTWSTMSYSKWQWRRIWSAFRQMAFTKLHFIVGNVDFEDSRSFLGLLDSPRPVALKDHSNWSFFQEWRPVRGHVNEHVLEEGL